MKLPSDRGSFHALPHLLLVSILAALISFLGAGCSRDRGSLALTTAPRAGSLVNQAGAATGAPVTDNSHWATFFPLAIGNRWHYSGWVRVVVEGGQNYFGLDSIFVRRSTTRELTGYAQAFGRQYVVGREDWTETSDMLGGNSGDFPVSFREDRSGLYTPDTLLSPSSGATPVALAHSSLSAARWVRGLRPSAAGGESRVELLQAVEHLQARIRKVESLIHGAFAGTGGGTGALSRETTMLSYPLRPGQQWDQHPDPNMPFRMTVEAVENLRLPAGRFDAYRIRIDPSGSPTPADSMSILIWYGPQAYLGIRIHDVGLATRDDGSGGVEVIGRVTYDESEVLDQLSLVDRR